MKQSFKYWLRCRLSHPTMRQFGLVSAVAGAMASFLSWTIKPGPGDVELARWMRGLSAVCFVTPIAALIWLSRSPALAPEYLARISMNFFESNGLCFLPVLGTSAGRCQITIAFENRFTRRCEVAISLKPTRVAFKDVSDLPAVRFQFSCPPGGFGKATKTLRMPIRLAAQKVLYDVTAGCRYPDGKGDELRFKPGFKVGPIGSDEHQDLKQVIGLLAHLAHIPAAHGPPARVTLVVPSDFQIQEENEQCELQIAWSLPLAAAS